MKLSSVFLRRSGGSGVLAGISALSAAAVLATAVPAHAGTGSGGAPAERAAAVVEHATGVADLVPGTAPAPDAAAKAVTGTAAGQVTVTAPAEAGGLVELSAADGSRVRLGLPEAEGVAGVATGSGTVVYPGAGGEDVDLAVQPTADGGARALVTLKDRSAARVHRFDLDLPEGSRLAPDGTGGYLIVREEGPGATAVLGAIDAPWAKDARGKAVRTAYRLEGDGLVQTVSPDAGTVFPVVADPKVSLGWSIYLRFGKAEVKKLAGTSVYHFAAVATVMACAKIPNAVAAAGCGAALTAQMASLRSQMQDAAKANQCVEWKVSYVGVITGWKRYKC